jgi:hypothetical protein
VDELQTNTNKILGIESSIPTIPSDLNEEWDTVKENANKVPEIESSIPTIPSDLNTKWDTVKINANKVPEIESSIPTIPSDLNSKSETVKANANKVPGIESKLIKFQAGFFCQTIIENAIINSPWINLFDKIKDGTKFATIIKSSIGEGIYPKITHTLLTAYYSSYLKNNISQVTDNVRKHLVFYYTQTQTYPAIEISVLNSTIYAYPRIYILISNLNGSMYREYVITQSSPKVTIDLTADLAAARPGEVIIHAQFKPVEFGGDLNEFYTHCINILLNVFFSSTYE